MMVREAGLEPARPKTQVPKTCVSAISPLPQTHNSVKPPLWIGSKIRGKLCVLPKRLINRKVCPHDIETNTSR